jgi:5-methylcytosine-specific restriction protein A
MPARPPVYHSPGWRPPEQSERERKARLDDRRGSSASRGYDHRWRKIRLAVLADEPLCRMCHERGRITAAQEVDHIDGNSRNNERDNLRPLCKPCHSGRTARDQGFAARR